jgi:hypothetical protein
MVPDLALCSNMKAVWSARIIHENGPRITMNYENVSLKTDLISVGFVITMV